MYTALVLTPESQHQLLAHFQGIIPPTYEKIAHHMTINMGPANDGPLASSQFKIGDRASINVIKQAYDGRVMAVAVETEVPSTNPVKHITIAVNRADGGKPFHSNQLTNWTPVTPLTLSGIIQECN